MDTVSVGLLLVTLKDPIERGLKVGQYVELLQLMIKEVTLKDTIERGLKVSLFQ